MNIKAWTIIIIFFTASYHAYGQEFLFASKSQIKQNMTLLGEIIAVDHKGNTVSDMSFNMIYFRYPTASTAKQNDVLGSMFFLRHDSCYKYMIQYGTDKYLKSFIDKFDASESKFKKVGKELRWKNAKGDQIEIKVADKNARYTPAFTIIYQLPEGACSHLKGKDNDDSLKKALMKQWSPAFSKPAKF